MEVRFLRCFFNVGEAASLLSCEPYPGADCACTLPSVFKVDSRQVCLGDAFVALRGQREDGHRYIPKAIERGASVILLESAYFHEHFDELRTHNVIFLPVSDTEKSMVLLARAWLDLISPHVIGITGSVGKTTTRTLLHRVLQGYVKTHSAIKSYNTLIGCSMTILSMPADTDILLLELGTNHHGEIGEIVAHFPITHGVITEIAPAHLEGLHSLEGVLSAKMEMADSRRLGFLSYNMDNSLLTRAVEALDASIEKIGVGESPADIRIVDIKQTLSKDGVPVLSFTILHQNKAYDCRTELFGRQHAKNVAFAFSVAVKVGLRPEDAMKGFGLPDMLPGRGRILVGNAGNMIIDESYNANPSSVSCALKNLVELELENGIRRIAILGGMRELGDSSRDWHREILGLARNVDRLCLIGEEWAAVDCEAVCSCEKWLDLESMIAHIETIDFSNAVVLVKGSRFYELERLLPLLSGAN